MDGTDWLAQRFEDDRTHLRAVAYRILGSLSEADDAVQEAWLRLHRADTNEVENLSGWLTTVVARVCLDMLRSRKSRREDPLDTHLPADLASVDGPTDPEHEALLADAVGPALVVVLDTLAPAERLAFVLHDLFAMPYDDIAGIVGRTPEAARQLASRARRRVQGAEPGTPVDRVRQRQIVDAFLNASRNGEFDTLLALLDPDVVLRVDAVALNMGATGALGAAAVAKTFSGRAKAARPAFINGNAGAVWSSGGKPVVVFDFTVEDGKILAIDMLADPARLAGLVLTV